MPRHLPAFVPLPFKPCRHTVVVATPEVRTRAVEFGALLPRLSAIADAEPLPRWSVTSPFGIDPGGLLRLIRIDWNEVMSANGILAAAASSRGCREGWERLAGVLARRHGLADLVIAWLRDRSPADATTDDRRILRDHLSVPPVAPPNSSHRASWVGHLLALHVSALEHAVACDGAVLSMVQAG